MSATITIPRGFAEQVRSALYLAKEYTLHQALHFVLVAARKEPDAIAIAQAVEAALAEPEHIHTCGPDCQKPPCVNRRREIAAAVEAEREACLKAAEQAKMHQMVWYPKGYTIDANKVNEMYTAQHVRCVEAIRARGSK
jgi:hypothetical protein